MTTQPPDAGRRTIGHGRYEIGALLGRGGMADVHVAQDVRLGRTVAVKRLRVDLAGDPTFQARFRREAQSAASLNHPAIVAVYDTGEEPDPSGSGVMLPYIVMELAEGRTLRDILREGRKILPERALEITAAVLSALDYSHRAGIVHRDIKPANVMLTPNGEVKVMDFGIARAIADASATMTQTAAVVGTAQYLSPEQARGEQVDARSDLYSTGCLLFELLTGRPPFVGDSPVSVAYQHVREEPSPPSFYEPGISPAVDAITLKALAKRVDARYQSAADMRADIERALSGRAVLAPSVAAADVETQPHFLSPAAGDASPTAVTAAYPPSDESKSRWWIVAIIAAVVLILILAAVLVVPKLTGGTTVRQVDVPSLIGKTVPEAKVAVKKADLRLATPTPQASDKPKGQIIGQSPHFPQLAPAGSLVHVTVSAGQAHHLIPDLTNALLSTAEARLAHLGFKTHPIKVVASSLHADHVIRTDPPAASTEKVGTTVDIYYSAGYIKIPSLVGLSQKQASALLRHDHFKPVVSHAVSDEPAGTVLRSNPTAGTPEPYGSTVVIVVSLGPTTPPTTTPPTTTPPSTTPPTSPPPTTPTDTVGGERR